MNKTALITGVCGGIGSGIAEYFSKNGWTVIGLDLSENCPEHVSHYRMVDISDTESLRKCIADLSGYMPRLNALINNAAVQVCKPILETTLEEWDLVMNTNVRSAFLLAQETYPYLQAGKGSIVNISSIHAQATLPGFSAYASSKGALSALTRSQAIEFAGDGIRVNAVLPGAVDTKMLEAGLVPDSVDGMPNMQELKKRLAEKTVSGKIGDPLDIASMVYFLSNNETADFITGQDFIVDGGALSKLGTD